MEQDITQTLALLDRTPRALDSLLRDLPDQWTLSNEGENTWNAFDILGHLIHCERVDWVPRIHIILEHGDSRPFEPLDREAQQRENHGKMLANLLDEFSRLRAQNLAELRGLNLQPESMLLPGQHPSLGRVTLSQLLAAWAAHDMTHLHQLSRIFAHQYADAVGPWRKYLGVLHCSGHSANS